MPNPTRRPEVRTGLALLLGAATLGVTACGSSSSSTPSTSSTTATSVAATTTTPSDTPMASDSSTMSSSASASDQASASTSASASSSGKHFTASQLDQAVAATVIDGQKITPLKQSDLQNVRELMADSMKHMQNVVISPAACRNAVNLGQVGSSMNTTAPMSIGQDKSAKVTLAATQLPAGTADTWKGDQLQKCGHMTLKGSISGVAVNESVTMTPLEVSSSQASNVHGMVETIVNKGKSTTSSLALGRVGDVAVEAQRQGRASAQQLQSDLDALATQVKKLG